MTIYSINKGIGWASSGVEFAQAYRSQVFASLGEKARFIFTDWISYENIEHLTSNMGFKDSQVIWLYLFFTDFKIKPTSFTTADLERHLPKIAEKKPLGKAIRYVFDDRFWATAYLKAENSDLVERVEYVSGTSLIRKDYFSYGRYCTEFYAPYDNRAKVYQRRFYNEDGTTAYDELIDGENDHIYKFKDDIVYSKQGLIAKLMKELHFGKKDIVLIDRAEGQGQEILENRGKARVGTIVHADHFSEPETNDETVLWNNFYEYEFDHEREIDFFVTATKLQKRIMEDQFKKYKGQSPVIYAIPVGSLAKLHKVPFASRKPFSIVTASRLATEKHLDWAIRAVAKAHETWPQLTFDIYGSGSEEANLREVIAETNSQGYIRLLGHQDLTEVYQHYQVYLSCSTSEGFGLSLMEAVGSGLAMIGFDVRYGNPTFIDPGKNGLLLPYKRLETMPQHVEEMAGGLCDLFSHDLASFASHSYKLASEFKTKKVAKLWKQAIERELHRD
ncbi:accessory Sec system glycosyltransferase GtfA [Lactobacillus sp. 23-2]|jgi:poly(glycerol-phosphate) alpha-glucosyltransferase|uniref:accessory Sec system glycosyltransferase GtfA n=1 Tax=Lactobacillus sp. 23-2 TaxID=2981842 RepID=UPI0038389047